MNKPEPSIPKRLMANPRTQIVLFLLALAYILSPIDFIPDTIPLLGWTDDLTVFLAEIVSFMLYLKEKRKNLHNSQASKDSEGTKNGSC